MSTTLSGPVRGNTASQRSHTVVVGCSGSAYTAGATYNIYVTLPNVLDPSVVDPDTVNHRWKIKSVAIRGECAAGFTGAVTFNLGTASDADAYASQAVTLAAKTTANIVLTTPGAYDTTGIRISFTSAANQTFDILTLQFLFTEAGD